MAKWTPTHEAPEPLEGPVVATITAAGWQRVSDEVLAERYVAIAAEAKSREGGVNA